MVLSVFDSNFSDCRDYKLGKEVGCAQEHRVLTVTV